MAQQSFKIRRGLDVPISGAPEQAVSDGRAASSCALIGTDYRGLKPRMQVEVGDKVKLGQPLFLDKRFDNVAHVAPAGGTVTAINRGARRVLQSVVIEMDGKEDAVPLSKCDAGKIAKLGKDAARDALLKSGLWTALRTRPYSKTPDPTTDPAAIFITAMDTSPLAADANVVIADAPEDFANGVQLIARLNDTPVYVCSAPGADLPEIDAGNVSLASFEGPHPAGLAGIHIHLLDPVHAEKTVWQINYQDVIAIGATLRTGRLSTERIISIAGPSAANPRLLRTRLGAATSGLIAGEVDADEVRIIAGNVLTGRTAIGPLAYLGRFHQQITLMEEGRRREPFGWVIPSMRKFATANVHLSSLFGRRKRYDFHTNLNGSPRAMVPVGLYEDVMPFDILATQLLRALLVLDTDDAQALGALELDEEDLALCTYVCLSKYEYGMALRANLDKIEAEG